jgi:hypothetical protein
MALWGVPIGGPNDAENAVRACIEMRQALAELNALRLSRGQSELRIGMGLNVGPVIAGNIGSHEKMEYTVIGDSVNLASRMESMTKEYGTDLLVPAAIQERLPGKFIFEKSKSAKVKGKTAPIEVYKVLGYVDESGQPVRVETAYSSYASEKSDKSANPEEPKRAPEVEEAEETTGVFTRDTTGLIEMPAPAPAPAPVVQAQPPIPEFEPEIEVELESETLPPLPPTEAPALPEARPASAMPISAIKHDSASTCSLFRSVPANSADRSTLRQPMPADAPASAGTGMWMIRIGGDSIGPMSAAELMQGFRSGELSGDWLVCPEGRSEPSEALSQWAQGNSDVRAA